MLKLFIRNYITYFLRPYLVSLLFFVFVVLVFSGMGYYSYKHFKDESVKLLQNHLAFVAQNVSKQVDSQYFSCLLTQQGIDSCKKRIAEPLSSSLKTDTLLSSIYLVHLEHQQVKFAFDISAKTPLDTLPDASFDEVYANPSTAMLQSLQIGKPQVEQGFSKDKWGSTMSAYSPIISMGRVLGVVGVDYNLENYQQLIQNAKLTFYWNLVFTLITAFLMSSISFVFIKQFKKMMDQSIEIAKLKDGYLAVLGHEMRTPLHGMIGIAQVMESKLEGELKEDIKAISNIGHTLNSVVTEILEYSNHKAMVSHRFSMSIHEFIHELKAAISYKLSKVNQDIEIDFDPSIQENFEIDTSRSILVCLSLLDNALKYASHVPKGIRIQKRFQALYFEVWDEGNGLPKDIEKRLGADFKISQNFLSSHSKGIGLGLSLCAKRVALMGGELKYQAGKPGASFYWSIPFVKSELAQEVEKDYSKLRILAVDDNKLNLKIIGRLLEKLAIQVDLALSGAEAIELCKKNQFDLILMDIQMPEMDGMETTQRIKELDSNSNQYIVALTANALESEKKIYMENGLDGVIGKPINESVLKSWINQIPNFT